MKRKLLVIIVTLLFAAASAWAVLPALAVIAPQLIGATLATVLVGGAVTKIAQSPSGTFTTDGSFLKVPVVAYNTYMQAGVQVALGYATSIPWDFKTAWNNGAFALVPEVQAVASSTFPFAPSVPGEGTVFFEDDLGGRTYKIVGDWFNPSLTGYWDDPSYYPPSNDIPGTALKWGAKYSAVYRFDRATNTRYVALVEPTNDSVNWPPPASGGIPDILSDEQAAQLAANLAAAQSDQYIKDALKDAVAANPGLLTPSAVQGAAIPGEAVRDHVAADADAAKQREIDKLTEAVAADPTNIPLQAQLEKAKAEQAQARADDVQDQIQEPAETFGPVSVSSFSVPYNPGTFDIPARFTTFVNRVKASPLFSFSNGFFNSLPGGGSPIYEIEAGQYGHHIVDLSQTMPTGLAVLKTILLACFGFLSIRAIIMKR